jgi:hypothetical protein
MIKKAVGMIQKFKPDFKLGKAWNADVTPWRFLRNQIKKQTNGMIDIRCPDYPDRGTITFKQAVPGGSYFRDEHGNSFVPSITLQNVIEASGGCQTGCCPSTFAFGSKHSGKICYNRQSYATPNATFTGPCGSWCTNDVNVGSGCGSNTNRLCGGSEGCGGTQITLKGKRDVKKHECNGELQVQKLQVKNEATRICCPKGKNCKRFNDNASSCTAAIAADVYGLIKDVSGIISMNKCYLFDLGHTPQRVKRFLTTLDDKLVEKAKKVAVEKAMKLKKAAEKKAKQAAEKAMKLKEKAKKVAVEKAMKLKKAAEKKAKQAAEKAMKLKKAAEKKAKQAAEKAMKLKKAAEKKLKHGKEQAGKAAEKKGKQAKEKAAKLKKAAEKKGKQAKEKAGKARERTGKAARERAGKARERAGKTRERSGKAARERAGKARARFSIRRRRRRGRRRWRRL